MGEFDFDKWAKLAQDDPEAFERRRVEVIGSLIDNADKHLQRRLRCLQWRIDAERSRCKTPYQAALRLHQMLLDHYLGEHGLAKAIFDFDTIVNGILHNFEPIPSPSHGSRILHFKLKETD